MECKCGMHMDESELRMYWCLECGETYLENEDGELMTDFSRAWQKLSLWLETLKKSNDKILSIKMIQDQMRKLINE